MAGFIAWPGLASAPAWGAALPAVGGPRGHPRSVPP